MKISRVAPLGLLLSGFALSGYSCTDAQVQQAQAIVAGLCAGAQVGSVVVAQDGTIVGASAKAQAKIAQGQQLVSVNCQATQQAITAVAAAMKTGGATALVAEENRQAAKLKIEPELMLKIISRYAP